MARYFLRFRHSDTGLSPSFTYFKKAIDLSAQVSPPISEVGNGTYCFDYSPSFDIVFEVDGGASIPTEEVRYIADTISPKDQYVDEPISQVKTDVWTDANPYSTNQKGFNVNLAPPIKAETDKIGDSTDASSATTVFGQMKAREAGIRGASNRDVTEVYDSVAAVNTSVSGVSTAVSGVQSTTTAIKAKTDNLPSDPASQSTTNTAISSVGTSVTAVSTKLGTAPAGSDVFTELGQIETKVDGIKTKTDNLPTNTATVLTTIGDDLKRALGMLHENSVLDLASYDTNNNLTSGRLRLYDTKANSIAAQSASPSTYNTGKIAEYTITATYTGENLRTYTVVREP